ncbi:MAG TPA: tetratricopeptide repeat protein [Longimicrobiales bacterium]
MLKSYSTRDVAQLLNISTTKVRNYARAGRLKPASGLRGEFLFNFQDLIVLRAAAALEAQRVPARTIARTLRKLRGQLPSGRSLTEVSIMADGTRVMVNDAGTAWNPLSGQMQIQFNVSELAARAEPIARKRTQALLADDKQNLSASEWFDLGVELEAVASNEAEQAYVRTLELDPRHTDAHVNLGRMLHEQGRLTEACTHYLQALRLDSQHGIAAYNLGVAMEDLGRLSEALKAYQQSAEANPDFPDVHYNLGALYEKIGNRSGAIRHFTRYRKLVGQDR